MVQTNGQFTEFQHAKMQILNKVWAKQASWITSSEFYFLNLERFSLASAICSRQKCDYIKNLYKKALKPGKRYDMKDEKVNCPVPTQWYCLQRRKG